MTAGRVRGTAWLLAATALAAPAHALDPASFVRVSAAVTQVEALRSEGGIALGSGVVVAPGRVVTNCHVTHDAVSIQVARGGDRMPVHAQAADVEHDLCVLDVPGLPNPPAVLGDARSLRIGDAVIALGFTGGFGLRRSLGQVVALHPLHDAPVIQSSNLFNSGASGGGLFDEQGRLVGVLTFRMRGGEAHYFSAPVQWLAPMLSSAARFEPVAPLPRERVPFWQHPPESQPAFLRAAHLAQGGRWHELFELASRWTRDAALDPTSWYALGLAAEALDRQPEALASYERAVAVDPRHAQGWLRLGLLSARLGFVHKARQALATLQPLSDELARQLAARLGAL
ncbi:S1 family peptidase [Azohydromonas sediminis]|uniref:S1 family peptidase n=1 Tax=Azohydromonas sediminis TaxID=2259674 RepID=UPI0013C312E2|nr:tetratricopeptide repeat-containing serine protease family protein [Azohydromonas sediminis]